MSDTLTIILILLIVNAIYFWICSKFFTKRYGRYFLRTYIHPSLIIIALATIVPVILVRMGADYAGFIKWEEAGYIAVLFFIPMFLSNGLFYFIIRWIKRNDYDDDEHSILLTVSIIGLISTIAIVYFKFYTIPESPSQQFSAQINKNHLASTNNENAEDENEEENEPGLSESELQQLFLNTFDTLSFIDAAVFYTEVREVYDKADTLFIDSVFSNYAYCSFLEIKDIKEILKDTPLCDTINQMFTIKREVFIENLEEELIDYANEQAMLFSDTIIPIILEEVDEKFAGDFELLIQEYKGAIGRIFDSAEDFKAEWRRKINVYNYISLIDYNLYDYNVNLNEFYNSYLENIGLDYNEYPLPTSQNLNLTFPRAIVNSYINNEQQKSWDNLSDIAIDGGLIILEWATGGMATPIVASVKIAQAGKTIYDIGNTVDEIYFDNQTMTDDEKLMVTCADYMNVEVTEFLEELYYTYLQNKTESVILQIRNTL